MTQRFLATFRLLSSETELTQQKFARVASGRLGGQKRPVQTFPGCSKNCRPFPAAERRNPAEVSLRGRGGVSTCTSRRGAARLLWPAASGHGKASCPRGAGASSAKTRCAANAVGNEASTRRKQGRSSPSATSTYSTKPRWGSSRAKASMGFKSGEFNRETASPCATGMDRSDSWNRIASSAPCLRHASGSVRIGHGKATSTSGIATHAGGKAKCQRRIPHSTILNFRLSPHPRMQS